MLRKLVFLSALGLVLALLSPVQAQDGQVLWEFWFGGAINNNISTLLNDGRYPYGPDLTEYSTSFTADKPASDYYGGRGRAYLTPPETGDYRIWVWSDDDSRVYLSTDEDPANAELVASVTGWTPANAWTNYASQKGEPKPLEAGKRYYIEGIYSDGTGGGNIGVGWTGPGIGDDPVIIDGQYLSAFVVTRHPAYSPDPANGAVDVTTQLFQWTAGVGAVMHDVYFGTDPELGPDTFKGRQPFALYFAMDSLTPGAQYYWRVDEVTADNTVSTGDVWTFTVMPVKAYRLSPYDGAIGRGLDTTLGWSAGNMAESHNVYFGTDKALVEGADASVLAGSLMDTMYDPNGLAAGTQYFWRVDEVQNDGTVIAGDVLSFTTASEGEHGARYEVYSGIGGVAVADLTSNAKFPGAPDEVSIVPDFEAPTDAADNYGARMTAFLNVPATAEYTFWVASDDASELWLGTSPADAVKIASVEGWTGSRAWNWYDTQKSAPMQLEAGRYFLMALMKEGGGGDNLSAAWQGGPVPQQELILGGFLEPFVPLWAEAPKPANGATDVAQSVVLSWAAGVQATAHDLYFGTDEAAVAAGDASVYQGQMTETTFDAGALEWGQVYYWRVDEIGEGGPWIGPVWSFTTADFLYITTSNTVVNYANFAEPFVTEVAVDVPADWTAGGVDDLNLQFQGVAGGGAGGSVSFDEASGTYTVKAAGADVWGASDEFSFVYKQLKGDGSIVARVTDVGTGSSTWGKAGVMVRQSLAANAPHIIMAMTTGDGGGIAMQGRQTAGGNSSSLNGDVTAAVPYWVKVTRTGNLITGSYSADGVTWTDMADASPDNSGFPMTNPTEIPTLGENVFIGLFATSHQSGEVRTFTMDNVTVTGDVTPAGTFGLLKEVGLSGNSAQPVYITVEDSSGAKATVAHPEAAASQIASMRSWKIPLADLAGVDLKNVAKLYLGVGDLAVPTPDGVGTVTFGPITATKAPVVPVDVTAPGDPIVGIPQAATCGGNSATDVSPCAELPPNVIDNSSATKYLNFKGDFDAGETASGFAVTPSTGATIVTGMTFTTANDAPERDPVAFELYGSNDGIDGPWTLIASGGIVDFADAVAWPRFTINATPITFENTTAYTSYQVLFTAVRNPATANSMQIAEVEILGIPAAVETPKTIVFVSFHGADDVPSSAAAGVGFTEAVDRGYTDLLEAQGYNVVRLLQTGSPDLAVVNAADLVIIGRSVASSSFQNANATTWNLVTAPMMVLNGYTARSSRMGYYTGTNIPDTTGDIKLAVADPMHPIFAGISLTDGVMTNPYAGLAVYPTDATAAYGISVVTNAVNDQGTVLATLAEASGDVTAGSVIIAEWPAGATLTHSGGAGTDVLGGHRLLFLTGSRENGGKSSETAGMFDLYPDGAQMFLNAVAYMLQ